VPGYSRPHADRDRDAPTPSTSDVAAAIAAEESSLADLYDTAPCGHLSTTMDGTIVRINGTLAAWTGYDRTELVGRRRFTDLLTVGGRIHHETHFAPLLAMQGAVSGMALDLLTAHRSRLPVLMSSRVAQSGEDGPIVIRTSVFEATDRRTYERELVQARQDADRERDRVQRLATVLQQTLLPPQLPDITGVDTAAYFHPASLDEVGGDFYDLFRLTDARWGFFLGDVCGKGAAAAVLTSLTRYTLRSAAAHDPDPVAVLTNLNAVLVHELLEGGPAFCTVLFGVLDTGPDRCTVTIAGGGHPPAILLRASGTAEFVDVDGGQLVGVLPDAHFVETVIHLVAGDTLLLYTDGLTEARIDDRRTRYSEDALLEFAATLAPMTAQQVVNAVTDLIAGFAVDDDAAILAIGIPGT
jgi:sigma-B regulation protein RsbU (phosphoserine phosphatase)